MCVRASASLLCFTLVCASFANVQEYHHHSDAALEGLLDQFEDIAENLPPGFSEADSVDVAMSVRME